MYKQFVSLSRIKTRYHSKSPIHTSKTPINEIGEHFNLNSTPIPQTKSRLESIQKKTMFYEKEQKTLRSKITFMNVDYEIELANKNLDLQKKLESLQKRNKKVSITPSMTPIGKVPEVEETLHREIKLLKRNIKATNKSIEENLEKIQHFSDKIIDLELKYAELQRQAPALRSENQFKLVFEELIKKFKILETSSKTTKVKLESKIREQEIELKSLQDQETQLQTKIFKQNQQKRLLFISENDYTIRKSQGIREISPIRQPNIDFLYKPSIKSLYNS